MKPMKKSVLVILLIIMLFGCQGTTSGQPKQPQEFRSGTTGLLMQYVNNLPPARLFDRDQVNIMIQVENQGTSPLGSTTDRIYLSGFDPTIITGIDTTGTPIPTLEPRSAFVTQGGRDAVSWKGQIRSLTDKRVDKYSPLLLATACYTYETTGTAQVCLDPNPYQSTSQQKVCIPTAVGLGSQGAPIAITSVDVQSQPAKTRFVISVTNSGGGTVFKYGPQYINKCSPYSQGLAFDEVDFVHLADITILGRSIKSGCKGLDKDGHLRLTNGQAQLFCEVDLNEQSAFLSPLTITLRYGYRQSIAKPIEIRAVP